MIRKFIASVFTLMAIISINAETIALPRPVMDGGLSVNRALAERHSTREFNSERSLSLQTIADLLWATCGINRPADGLRTNPTGRNCQEIDAYWFNANGVYLYDFKNNALIEVANGDYRGLLAGTEAFRQDFVLDAPGAVLFVIDTTKLPEGEGAKAMSLIDVGIACENLNIFCAAHGLATVPRITMDIEGIRHALSLPATAIPAANNPVGYSK